jgi:hypothetical protein
MEYYIGFELIRFLIISMLVARSKRSFSAAARQVVPVLPFVLIGAAFFVWRVYFFVGDRNATDAAMQLGPFLSAPVQTILHWSAVLLQDFLDVVLAAWYIPLAQLFSRLGVSQILLGLAAGIIFTIFALPFNQLQQEDERDWIREALFLGV